MNGPVEIAIGVSHRSWAQELFRHVADHGGAVVRTRVLLEEDALESSYSVLVVDDSATVLSPRLVAELHRRDRRVIAVHAAGDHAARESLGRLGVDAALPDSATPEELVEAILAVAPKRALLRTSVMATHTERHIDDALHIFEVARSSLG